MAKITATIEVTRSGRLDIDGQQHYLENLSDFKGLYKVEDFRFKLIRWCGLVSETQMNNAERALKVFGYEVER